MKKKKKKKKKKRECTQKNRIRKLGVRDPQEFLIPEYKCGVCVWDF
jgi:hypothetical protein